MFCARIFILTVLLVQIRTHALSVIWGWKLKQMEVDVITVRVLIGSVLGARVRWCAQSV